MASEVSGVTTGQPNLHKQDLSKLDVRALTALSPEVISRQATINIGTIGHVAHGKSTVVKAISGVQTVRFKNELERNITIKLERLKFDVNGRVVLPQELKSQGIRCEARLRRRARRRRGVQEAPTFAAYVEDAACAPDARVAKRRRTSGDDNPGRNAAKRRKHSGPASRTRMPVTVNAENVENVGETLNMLEICDKTSVIKDARNAKFLEEVNNILINICKEKKTFDNVLRENNTRLKVSKQNNHYFLTDDEDSCVEDDENDENDLEIGRGKAKRRSFRLDKLKEKPQTEQNGKDDVSKDMANAPVMPKHSKESSDDSAKKPVKQRRHSDNEDTRKSRENVQQTSSRPRRSCCSANLDYFSTKIIESRVGPQYPSSKKRVSKPEVPEKKDEINFLNIGDAMEDLPQIDTTVLQDLHLDLGDTARKMWNNIDNNVYVIDEFTELKQEFNGTELRIIKQRKCEEVVDVEKAAESRPVVGQRRQPVYEVEEIVGMCLNFKSEMYLVKWTNYASECNTWEPYEHLSNTSQALSAFYELVLEHIAWEAIVGKFGLHADIPSATLSQLLPPGGFAMLESNKTRIQRQLIFYYAKQSKSTQSKILHHAMTTSLHYELILRRKKQQRKIVQWESCINKFRGENKWVAVQNDVDLAEPPAKFTYVNDYVITDDVEVDCSMPRGCDCPGECMSRVRRCCGWRENGQVNYSKAKRVRIPQGFPIFECNDACGCKRECRNRVVQCGSQVLLEIFRTSNECGWGVKALQSIRKGEFVCQYVGEVITHDEAEARGKIYDRDGMTYLFDLDFDSKDNLYTVDAAQYGNVSHFINHSCDPNIGVWTVWINCIDRNLPQLALFALRDIKRNEELTFDYMCDNRGGSAKHSPVSSPEVKLPNKALCRCNADNCRRYLF